MGVLHPYNREAQEIKFTQGNFGLWFNKYIPIADEDSDNTDKQDKRHEKRGKESDSKKGDQKTKLCKVCDENGDTTMAIDYYFKKYEGISKYASEELKYRHTLQKEFIAFMKPQYEIIELRAKLVTPLITGIGYQHPSETSLLFEHNLGIPYIPASSIKGIVRFAATLGLLDSELYKDETFYGTDTKGRKFFHDELTPVGELFGYSLENTDKSYRDSINTKTHESKPKAKRGSVIFLDAYPESVPSLTIDIVNPHYPNYYKKSSFPSDNQDPRPIKFLAVSSGTIFIFRAIVKKDNRDLLALVKEAFRNALCEEGVGAKTALGYGKFKLLDEETSNQQHKVSNTFTSNNTAITEVAVGKQYDVKVEGITKDGQSVQVILPNNKKAIIGKTQFPREIQNNFKQFFKGTVTLRVEVTAYQSGNYQVKFIEVIDKK